MSTTAPLLRCTRCGRILLRAAATVQTYQGTAHYGPTCAVSGGIVQPPARRVVLIPRERRARATRQMPLGL